MDLSKFFIYVGRFLIAFYLIVIFIVSVGELYYQSSTSLASDSATSQLFLNNLLQNINAKPISSLSLTDPNTACSSGSSIDLAYFGTGTFCQCNSTYFVLAQCTEEQLNQGCIIEDSKDLDMQVWKGKAFCQNVETYWNYSTRSGTCEENMTYCDSGICVNSSHACPIAEIKISQGIMPNTYESVGNLSGDYAVWISNQSSSTVIDLLASQQPNSSCYNEKLILNYDGVLTCLSYEDDYTFQTLDNETFGAFYQDNNLTTSGNGSSNSLNSSIYLLYTTKVQVYSDGDCASLNGMESITIYSDFSDYDNYRLISLALGIAFPIFCLLLFFIYLCVMKATTSAYRKDKRSFVFFWILHLLGSVLSIVILAYDYLSYDFLISLQDNNEFLYDVEAGNCFGQDYYQSFFTTLVEDIEGYYSTREDWMEVGLVFSAAYFVFEAFYLIWFACGYGCKDDLQNTESEVELKAVEINKT